MIKVANAKIFTCKLLIRNSKEHFSKKPIFSWFVDVLPFKAVQKYTVTRNLSRA